MTELKLCPHCGSAKGFFTKDRISGSTITKFNYDKTEYDNSEMYDGICHTLGKKMYCLDCEKYIGKFDIEAWNRRAEE